MKLGVPVAQVAAEGLREVFAEVVADRGDVESGIRSLAVAHRIEDVAILILEIREGEGWLRNGVLVDAAHIDVHVEHEVRTKVAGRVWFAGPDRALVGATEDVDEAVAVADIRLEGALLEGGFGVADAAEAVVQGIGILPNRVCAGEGVHGPVIDLVEVGIGLDEIASDDVGVDVEGDGIAGDSERVHPVVGIVEGPLDLVQVGGDGLDVLHGGAVHLRNPFEV